MDFEKKVPEWRAEGVEPSESLKTDGFQAGYKPPASFFNWFWSGVSACLTELRSKLSGHADNTSNPHKVTKHQVGLGYVDNTADASKSVMYASKAGASDKVNNDFVLRLNGGAAEGTSLFTYNGSAGKSVNITPGNIGAAKADLSNVDADDIKTAMTNSGAGGIPIVAATSTDGVAYTAEVPGVERYSNGLLVTIIPNMTSTSANITLAINGMSAKMVRLPLSFNNAAMASPRLDTYYTAGRPITLQYDAGYLNGDGIWKVYGKQRASAQDLYGTVPIENGGTGAETAEAARAALGITAENMGALPLTGGNMTGILYNSTLYVVTGRDADGNPDALRLRSLTSNDHAELLYTDDPWTQEYNSLQLYKDKTSFGKPVDIMSGGTGARNAASARKNLGIPTFSYNADTQILTITTT